LPVSLDDSQAKDGLAPTGHASGQSHYATAEGAPAMSEFRSGMAMNQAMQDHMRNSQRTPSAPGGTGVATVRLVGADRGHLRRPNLTSAAVRSTSRCGRRDAPPPARTLPLLEGSSAVRPLPDQAHSLCRNGLALSATRVDRRRPSHLARIWHGRRRLHWMELRVAGAPFPDLDQRLVRIVYMYIILWPNQRRPDPDGAGKRYRSGWAFRPHGGPDRWVGVSHLRRSR
jgi:hypothetical protein